VGVGWANIYAACLKRCKIGFAEPGQTESDKPVYIEFVCKRMDKLTEASGAFVGIFAIVDWDYAK